MDQLSLFNNSDKANKKELENIERLFFSGVSESQNLALAMCNTFSVSKGELIWKYLIKGWNKSKIIERVGLAYADGVRDLVVWYKFPPVNDIQLRIEDNTSTISLDSNGYDFLAYWDGRDVDEMYIVVRKKINALVLSKYKHLFKL